jgi:Cytochrome c
MTPTTSSDAPALIVRPRPSRWLLKAFLTLLVLVAAGGGLYWYAAVREVETVYAEDADHFKYGSIGNEADNGVPYWVWLVLPRAFPEHLPGDGGYASLGLVWEQPHVTADNKLSQGGGCPPVGQEFGYSVPVGFSVKSIGIVPRVALNCAFCHNTAVRRPGDVAPTLFPAGPAQQFSPQAYIRFLSDCGSDPRFTPEVLMPLIEYNVKLSAAEKLMYQTVVIPRTREGLLGIKKAYAWTNQLADLNDGKQPVGRRTDWGHGRIDPFNPVKFNVNVLKLDPATDNTTGNSDMPPIWNLQPRDGMVLHWDGLNNNIREVMLSSAIGDGSAPKTLPLKSLERMENYLRKLQPPKWTDLFPAPDPALVARGKEIYHREKCDVCHDFGGKRTGTAIPIDEIGTDPERHKLWTDEAAKRYNAYAADYPWKFNNFRGTTGPQDGYASVPLDGVWIRAPFLHNGSVPNLKELFQQPDKRTKVFYRGNDEYDPEAGGFVTTKARDGWRVFTKFDTSLRANGNGGHLYGTQLKDDEKADLVAYLKTL